MAYLKLLTSVTLIIIISIDYTVSEKEEQNINSTLNNLIVPHHYDIRIVSIAPSSRYYVKIDMFFEIKYSTIIINLPYFISTTQYSLINTQDGKHYEITFSIIDNNLKITKLYLESIINPGIYMLCMESIDNVNKMEISNVGGYEWIPLTPFHLSTAQPLPCWSKRMEKATFNITVVVNRNFNVLSNTKVKKKFEFISTTTTVFESTPLMPIHLMEIMVTNYKNVTMKNNNFTIWYRLSVLPHIKFAKDIVEKVILAIERYMEKPWNFPKIDLVVIPEKSHAKQKWGLILISETNIVYDEKLDSADHKIEVATTITRELIHQWLNSLISPTSCYDLWFNDVLVSYLQIYILNEIYPEWRMKDIFAVQYQQLAFRTTIDLSINPVPQNDNQVGISDMSKNDILAIQIKGPFLIRMLEHVITEYVLWKSIKIYLYNDEFKMSNPNDFWTIVENNIVQNTQTNQSLNCSIFVCCSLKEIMFSWRTRKDYPIVTVTRNYNTKNALISQNSADSNKEDSNWWIPITFIMKSNPDFLKPMSQHFLRPNESITLYDIIDDDWIIFNVQQVGYYRVNYDINNWLKIADYLNSDEYINIHPINRAQILDDAYYFTKSNQTDKIFFQIMSYLKQEIDYIVWYPMKHILPYLWDMSKYLGLEEVRDHLLPIWHGLLYNVGYIEHPTDDDITKMKRLFAIQWACRIGNQNCKENTHAELQRHIATNVNKTLSDWEKVIYCAGLMSADVITWKKVFKRYTDMHDVDALEYLACSENDEILLSYIATIQSICMPEKNVTKTNSTQTDFLIYNTPGEYEYEDYEKAYRNIVKNHIEKVTIFNYILNNFSETKPKTMSKLEALDFIIKNIHRVELLEKIKELIEINIELKTTFFYLDAALTARKSHIITTRAEFMSLNF